MKTVPFEFVLEALARANPRVKPMFGCQAVYVGEKVVLLLRKRKEYEADNGVWVATAPEHHVSLKKDLCPRWTKVFLPMAELDFAPARRARKRSSYRLCSGSCRRLEKRVFLTARKSLRTLTSHPPTGV